MGIDDKRQMVNYYRYDGRYGFLRAWYYSSLQHSRG
jgi:hypothetical protein